MANKATSPLTECYFCKGVVVQKRVRHVHLWGETIFILEDVPAEVCNQCGEVYFTPEVLEEMDRIVEKSLGHESERKMQVPVYSFSHM